MPNYNCRRIESRFQGNGFTWEITQLNKNIFLELKMKKKGPLKRKKDAYFYTILLNTVKNYISRTKLHKGELFYEGNEASIAIYRGGI
jgi:hypothetical protein